MDFYAVTHRGKVREENQDTIYLSQEEPRLAIVADGMGGHNAGRIASEAAVSFFLNLLGGRDLAGITPQALCELVEETNRKEYKMAQEDSSLDGMGTTFTVAVVLEDQIVVSHVGDTRAYLWREGELSQLTTDHSYVQFLVSKGILTPEEAGIHPYRNIITRALGMEEVIADSYTARIAAGDRVLLCSDGLTTHVNDAQISAVLAKEAVAKQQAEELLALAMSGGGTDNISVIVGKIDGKTEG